jgi:hypothetical protein
MMTSKNMMKEMPKNDGKAIPDDPRIGIGINSRPEPSGLNLKMNFVSFLHKKLLCHHQQQQTVCLDMVMMMLQSVIARATSAQHRKLVQEDVLVNKKRAQFRTIY